MRVSIDIDDVTLSFFPHFRDYCGERNPPLKMIRPFEGDIGSWFGLDENGFREVHEEFTSSSFYDSMPLVKGFAEVYSEIVSSFDPLHLTARSQRREKRTIECIKRQIPSFDIPIYFSGEFYGRGKNKGQICKEKGVFVHVEDNPDYISSCIENGIYVLLFSQPWNRKYSGNGMVQRVEGWEDVMEKLNLLEKRA